MTGARYGLNEEVERSLGAGKRRPEPALARLEGREAVVAQRLTYDELNGLLTLLLLDPVRDLPPEDDLVSAFWERALEHVTCEVVDALAEGDASEREAFYGQADEVVGEGPGVGFIEIVAAPNEAPFSVAPCAKILDVQIANAKHAGSSPKMRADLGPYLCPAVESSAKEGGSLAIAGSNSQNRSPVLPLESRSLCGARVSFGAGGATPADTFRNLGLI